MLLLLLWIGGKMKFETSIKIVSETKKEFEKETSELMNNGWKPHWETFQIYYSRYSVVLSRLKRVG